jgi:hypothetical protein
MRLVSAALGVFLLLALLTWLLLRGIDTNAPAYAATLQAFDDFALAEASLHRDVLQARAGLLRNYDTFAIAMEAMEEARWRAGRSFGCDGGPAGGIDGAIQEQQRAFAEFAVLRWPTEHESGVRRSGRATRTCHRCNGSSVAPSEARRIAGRRQGAPGTDQPVCGASAHCRAGRGSGTGAARACPPTAGPRAWGR